MSKLDLERAIAETEALHQDISSSQRILAALDEEERIIRLQRSLQADQEELSVAISRKVESCYDGIATASKALAECKATNESQLATSIAALKQSLSTIEKEIDEQQRKLRDCVLSRVESQSKQLSMVEAAINATAKSTSQLLSRVASDSQTSLSRSNCKRCTLLKQEIEEIKSVGGNGRCDECRRCEEELEALRLQVKELTDQRTAAVAEAAKAVDSPAISQLRREFDEAINQRKVLLQRKRTSAAMERATMASAATSCSFQGFSQKGAVREERSDGRTVCKTCGAPNPKNRLNCVACCNSVFASPYQ